MPALNFKKQFAEAVRNGDKTQTIRATRKRPIKEGDTLYLYTGQRTKGCEKLSEVRCTSVESITMWRNGNVSWPVVMLNGKKLKLKELKELVTADGFAATMPFAEFFLSDTNEFKGQLIKWGER